MPPPDNVQSLLLELRNEIRSLKAEVSDLKQEVKSLKDANTQSIIKLTEEVISVKLANRSHHRDPILDEEFADIQHLPFDDISNLEKYEQDVQQNDNKLTQFKRFIAKTGVWNADGLIRHQLELAAWMKEEQVDVMLVSESHLNDRSYLKMNGFSIYAANQPGNCSFAGAAIIINSRIYHYPFVFHRYNFGQVVGIKLLSTFGDFILASSYIRPVLSPDPFSVTEFKKIIAFSWTSVSHSW
ncbi:hypothetical protein ACLKA6_002504 [Drosophila palustris]